MITPRGGCPTGWKLGWRYQDNEDTGNLNRMTSGHHFNGEDILITWFCKLFNLMKTQNIIIWLILHLVWHGSSVEVLSTFSRRLCLSVCQSSVCFIGLYFIFIRNSKLIYGNYCTHSPIIKSRGRCLTEILPTFVKHKTFINQMIIEHVSSMGDNWFRKCLLIRHSINVCWGKNKRFYW